jgi:ABC-type transporter Mla subunit MlaD
VVADKLALGRLVSATAEVSTALAARSGDLGGAVANTAATFREIASERAALEDTISRAPAVLRQSTAVLGDVDRALVVLDPTLVDLQPVAGRLARLLALIVPAGREAIPTIAGIQALVPSSKRALLALPGVVRVATPAVTSLTRALRQSAPLLSGLRPYAPDSVAGFFNGNGGASGGTYDANGHYLKGLLTFQGNGGSSLTGLLNLLGKLSSSAGPYNGERSGLLAPCPGGGNPAAPDRSNPWNSPDTLPQVGKVCNPGDSQR